AIRNSPGLISTSLLRTRIRAPSTHAVIAQAGCLTYAPACFSASAGAFALELAVEVAFGLAAFAGEALEGFFFVDAGFGLDLGDTGSDARVGRGSVLR